MWKYNPGLFTLVNKDGNWMYLEKHWTLPLKRDEKKNVNIETLEGEVLSRRDDESFQIVLKNIYKSLHATYINFF